MVFTGLLSTAFIPLIERAVRVIQDAAKGGVDLAALGQVSGAIVALFMAKYWFTRGQSYYLSRAAARLATDLRARLFSKLQKLPITYFNQRRAGAIQSVLTNDVSVYQTAVTIVRDSIEGPIKAVGAFGTIIYIQPILASIVVLFMPLLVWIVQRNAKRMKVAQRQVQDDLSNLNASTQEALQGTRVVKAFGAEAQVGLLYRGLVEKAFESQMRATRRTASLRPLVELIGALAIALVLFVSGYLANQGLLKVSELAACIFALDVINQGVRNLASVNNTYAQVQAASERIYAEVLDQPDEHGDESTTTLPEPKGRIEFKNVSFVYPDGTPALRDVSFILEPGTSLALVGPSGAGKSTIADLVLRFYDPTEGSISFDGHDVRDLKKSWLREQIGVVPQQTFLFAGTISENIRLGSENATDHDVEDAGRQAHVNVIVDRSPVRYSLQIGEGGSGLSGGEKQRVAIARALVRKPTLLLLDEATSALDATSEKVVTEALEEAMHQRTTLFIAHRLTTAARADRILYLRRGEVVEEGAHKELMDQNGEYAALFRVFSNGVLDDGLH